MLHETRNGYMNRAVGERTIDKNQKVNSSSNTPCHRNMNERPLLGLTKKN